MPITAGGRAKRVLTDTQAILADLANRDEAGRRRSWTYSILWGDDAITLPLVQTALEALDGWGRVVHDEEDRFLRNAIHGAFLVLRRATTQSRDYDDLIPRCVVTLFDCENVWVAGLAIRYFEWFPRFQEHCLTQLVGSARDHRILGAVPFNLASVAFVVLWNLRPDLAKLPDLRPSWQQCITDHLEFARQISDSPDNRDVYERNCLIANQLMWL